MADREFGKAWVRSEWQRVKKALFSPTAPVKHNSTPRKIRFPPGSKARCKELVVEAAQAPSMLAWLEKRLARFKLESHRRAFMGKGN